MSDRVGKHVQGAFTVSPRRRDIGPDGKDFPILRGEIRGPVYGRFGVLEIPQFQQGKGPVSVTERFSRHQPYQRLEGICRAFRIIPVKIGQTGVFLGQGFHPYVVGRGCITASREQAGGQ